MSYLKTINIQHLTSGTNNIVLDANGNMTCAGTVSAGSSMGMRNRLINGDMRIDQRNAGANVSVQTTTSYTLDRWCTFASQNSKFTAGQNLNSVTPPAGFSHYFGASSSSTYSIAAGDYFGVYQRIEGFNFADLAWGTANAAPIVISFWVRSSLTGTYGGALRNSAADRGYPFTYTINTANTWEYKTVSIAGDTAGTWIGATNGIGVNVQFSIGTGSTYSFTPGAWGSYSAAISATGATSLVGTNGATWYITGVQLEVGTIATPFERRQYGHELALCQRYYWRLKATNSAAIFCSGLNTGTTTARHLMTFPVPMRTSPTSIDQSGTASDYRLWHGSGTTTNLSAVPVLDNTNEYNANISLTVASGLTGGGFSMLIANSGNSGYIGWSAEL